MAEDLAPAANDHYQFRMGSIAARIAFFSSSVNSPSGMGFTDRRGLQFAAVFDFLNELTALEDVHRTIERVAIISRAMIRVLAVNFECTSLSIHRTVCFIVFRLVCSVRGSP
ncbi:hypothetical protein [Paraburkholderia youngii]|uniref:hypothetical protein n=1 Tax=Paraburkholderia youngii TaxID=2782701 RepID=UPI003D262E98